MIEWFNHFNLIQPIVNLEFLCGSPKVWDLCLEHEELLRLADEQVRCPSHVPLRGLVLPGLWVKE